MEKILNLISLTKNNIKDIKLKIDCLEQNLELIKKSINQEVVIQGSPIIKNPENQKTILDLVKSSEWPLATTEYQILDDSSEEEKKERAEGIISFFLDDEVIGKKILDLGCGEGHCVIAAAKERASFSIGYDIEKKGNLDWEEEKEKYLITTSLDKVRKKGPYDIILIYDVIDHIENIHPIDLLRTAKNLLKPDGKIHIRFHPWSSRHGGHAYKQLNKAFIHFILNDQELQSFNIELNNTLSVYKPVVTYKELIEQSNLSIEKENIEREIVEDFFEKNNQIRNRILKNFEVKEFPRQQMEMCFVDFVLTH